MSVRPPAVAGTFYPGTAHELAATVDALVASAPPPRGPAPKAIVVPHAGYVYSGPVAATAGGRTLIAVRPARHCAVGPAGGEHPTCRAVRRSGRRQYVVSQL
ncbi:MAG TPA: AmmeMemoRadiSam system protein B [Acidimicrobiia bacterium]|nr:AmmeMemoRadiSam system protein B [Acidimicrobiia bacterium]